MSVRDALELALRGSEVPGPLLRDAFAGIVRGEVSPVAAAGLLVALRARGETVDELVAVARVLREAADTAPLPDPATVDTCGTGGDGAGTFNISTGAALVAAGAGIPVAKHGNRAVSSRAGSIDVLEALGVEVDLPVAASARILREVGIAAFLAPRAHPAMRQLAPVRRELGVRTLMNAMGPLLNPLGVRRQVVGVYEPRLVEVLAAALRELGAEEALVVHGSDGLDEITLTGPTRAARAGPEGVRSFEIHPTALGLSPAPAEALRGGDPKENAEVLRAILEGRDRGPRRDVVRLNAAAALLVGGRVGDLREGLEVAAESLDSGAAAARLAALVRASRREAGAPAGRAGEPVR